MTRTRGRKNKGGNGRKSGSSGKCPPILSCKQHKKANQKILLARRAPNDGAKKVKLVEKGVLTGNLSTKPPHVPVSTPEYFWNPNWIPMRPISRLWVSQYAKALSACSNPKAGNLWYNIRVLRDSASIIRPDKILKALQCSDVVIKELIALDLGWTLGEWMIKVKKNGPVKGLIARKHVFLEGVFIGGHKKIPEVEFIITPVLEQMSSSCLVSKSTMKVSVVLMGIPFYDSNLDLSFYLFEAITAQNKNLGIISIQVMQRYKIGGAQTNDVRCHVSIDPNFIHHWQLATPMKILIQGWDNDGVPRPEMWPVTLRFIDECLTCGGFCHFDQDGRTLVDCDVIRLREKLLNRRQNKQNNAKTNSEPTAFLEPYQQPVVNHLPLPTPTQDSSTNIKTSIGFIIAP